MEREREEEQIIIDNLNHAVNLYKHLAQEFRNYVSGYDCFGFVEVFEPHIHQFGEIAYFPDNENYIGRIKKDDGGEIVETHELKEEKFFGK
jgi:hypothetical protein